MKQVEPPAPPHRATHDGSGGGGGSGSGSGGGGGSGGSSGGFVCVAYSTAHRKIESHARFLLLTIGHLQTGMSSSLAEKPPSSSKSIPDLLARLQKASGPEKQNAFIIIKRLMQAVDSEEELRYPFIFSPRPCA